MQGNEAAIEDDDSVIDFSSPRPNTIIGLGSTSPESDLTPNSGIGPIYTVDLNPDLSYNGNVPREDLMVMNTNKHLRKNLYTGTLLLNILERWEKSATSIVVGIQTVKLFQKTLQIA